jgi:hypothetical protein
VPVGAKEQGEVMQKKIVFIDIDGTTMDENGQISSRTVHTIQRLKEAGIPVVVNTGRILAEVQDILQTVGLHLPVIGANGGYYTDDMGQEVIYTSRMPADQCLRIIEICKNYEVLPCFSTPMHFHPQKPFLEIVAQKLPGWQEHAQRAHVEIPQCVDAAEWPQFLQRETAVKCSIVLLDTPKTTQLKRELEDMGTLELTSENQILIEYNNIGTTKGSGMLHYLAAHGLQAQHAVAVGDGDNDLPMLQQAGFSIAMGNADALLHQVADYTTDTVWEDGLATALEKHLLAAKCKTC